jgi:hypothetical protein
MGKAPLFVRPPTDAERQALEEGLRSPDARLARLHPEGLLGCADEVWWRRLAPPALSAWPEDAPPWRLIEQTVARDDPDPQALACYGLLARWGDTAPHRSEDLGLRFGEGRPVSAVTSAFLAWCAERAQEDGKRAVLVIWDTASWHDRQSGRPWVRQHNRPVKQAGHGVRLVVCYLPTKSPWLNPSAPTWLHGKKRVAEPARLLSAQDLEDRVCAAFGCVREPHLLQPHSQDHKSKKAA